MAFINYRYILVGDEELDQSTLKKLRWMLQKDSLGQVLIFLELMIYYYCKGQQGMKYLY
jgi:hypothetical protein